MSSFEREGLKAPLSAALALGLATLAGPAAAADKPAERLSPVVVTATRLPTPIEEVGSSLTVITAEEIARKQHRTVADALSTVPGLNVAQSGPTGTQASVFARGGNSNHALILLNGRRVSEPGTPTGAFNFAHFSLANVERIEVVRGPQSALYGSDAIGGVINIITKRGKGEPEAGGTLEIGSALTHRQAVFASGATERADFHAELEHLSTSGFDITPVRYRPAGSPEETDGYRNISGSIDSTISLTDALDLRLFGQAIDTRTDTDASANDPNSKEETQQLFADVSLEGSFLEDAYRPSVALSYQRFDRRTTNETDSFSDDTADVTDDSFRWTLATDHDFDLDENHTLSAGAEWQHEDYRSKGEQDFGGGFVQTNNTDADTDTLAFYLQDRFAYFDRLFGTVSMRYDRPEDFADAVTFSVSPTYRIEATGTRLKGSVGTGYKVPSLHQRFGYTPTSFGTAFNGNPNLDPERSFGWEAGFEQPLADDTFTFGATYFDNDIKNAINTVFDAGFNSSTVNNEDVETWGVESFVEVHPTDSLTLRFDHTFLRSEVKETGTSTLRRPKHTADLEVRYQATEALETTATAHFESGVRDVGLNGGYLYPASFTVVDLKAAYALSETIDLFARATNLLDKDYERADGFKAPGREIFLGATARF